MSKPWPLTHRLAFFPINHIVLVPSSVPFLGYLVWNLSQKETHTLRLLLNAWTSPLLWTLRACCWDVCVSICWGLSKPTVHLKPVHNGPQAGFLQTYRESASNADNRRKMRSGYSLRGRTLFIPVKRDAKKKFYFSDICIVGPRKKRDFQTKRIWLS